MKNLLPLVMLVASIVTGHCATPTSDNFNRKHFIWNPTGPVTNWMKLNLDTTQFTSNTNIIHINSDVDIGRQYWTMFSGNLFPVGFAGNSNRFVIRQNTGFTGSGTNYFADDGTFHPLITQIDSTNLWANIGGVYIPTQEQNQLLATNVNSALTLVALGAFTMPSSLQTNLVAGLNEINPYQQGFININGASSDPADSQITLSSGNGQGQLLLIENYGAGNAFTITNNTPLWDDPFQFIRLGNGDWRATQQGETMLLHNDGFGWNEVTRFGGGIPNNYWRVDGNDVLQPIAGSSVWVTNLTSFDRLQAAGSFTTPALALNSVTTGTNTINLEGVSLVNVSSMVSSDAVVELTVGDGDIGQHIWLFNVFTNTGFCLYSGVTTDDPLVRVQIRGDEWCPTDQGESIELVRQAGAWVEIGRSNPNGGIPDAGLWFTNSGSASISPYVAGTKFTIDSLGQIGIGVTNIYSSMDIGIFHRADLEGSLKAWINIAGADTWPSVSLFTEWWVNAGTNNGVMDLCWGNGIPGDTATILRDHLFTVGEDSSFFKYTTKSNNVETFKLMGDSGNLALIKKVAYDWPNAQGGAGTFLQNAGDGTLSWVAGTGGGTTINPTDGFMPVRQNSTTFADSPWFADSSSQVTLKSGGSGIVTLYSSPSIGHVSAAANRSLYLDVPTVGYDMRFTIAGVEQWEIDPDGNILSTQSGINNIGVDNNGSFNGPAKIFSGNNLGIRNAHTPASSSETNIIGAICFDATYLYMWTNTNVNKRIAWTTW